MRRTDDGILHPGPFFAGRLLLFCGRARRSVIDEVRALQVETAGTQVSAFESLRAKLLLDGETPLLDVLLGARAVVGAV